MERAHAKDVLKLGSPLLAGIFAEYIMFIADSVMIGRLRYGLYLSGYTVLMVIGFYSKR